MPTISVLMPCYNMAATLEDTLESIAIQSLDGFEVMTVDDGSEEPTLEIFSSWANRD
jgi:glycosyltransferase involved in cell wall biosynthesis